MRLRNGTIVVFAVAGLVLFWIALRRPWRSSAQFERSAAESIARDEDDGALSSPAPANPPDAASETAGTQERQNLERRDCSWFEPWRLEEVSRGAALDLLAAVRPLRESHVACLSNGWLIAILNLHCSDSIPLDEDELSALDQEIANRSFVSSDITRGIITHQATEGTWECLTRGIISHAGDIQGNARLYGCLLVTTFGSAAEWQVPNPRLVALLTDLMADWPIDADEWWQGLWDGFPAELQADAISIRVGIYEALSLILPREVWLERLAMLADLEDPHSASPYPTRSLYAMGKLLAGKFEAIEYTTLIGASGGDSWQRALIFGFPAELGWPSAPPGALPEFAYDAIVRLRDSGSELLRASILSRQWELLGPMEAAADLERFVDGPVLGVADWEAEAALRVRETLNALSGSKVRPADEAAMERARSALQRFLRESRYEDLCGALRALRDRFGTFSGGAEARHLALEIGGDEWLANLPEDLRTWLAQ